MVSGLRFYVYKKMPGLDMSSDKLLACFEYEEDANIYVTLLNYRYGDKVCYMLPDGGRDDL